MEIHNSPRVTYLEYIRLTFVHFVTGLSSHWVNHLFNLTSLIGLLRTTTLTEDKPTSFLMNY